MSEPYERGEPSINERKISRLYAHPDECPEGLGLLPFLIHPPSRMSATSAWIRFRDRTLRPLRAENPTDPAFGMFLEQVAAILAFRESVPPEERFWKAD